jgi:hypothetical protein
MALTRKLVVAKKGALKLGQRAAVKTGTIINNNPALRLPTSPSVPSDDMGDYSWMFYGAKKIGKTSLAAQFPDALFFMFEPGAKALKVYTLDCSSWANALGYLKLLEDEHKKGTLRYKTFVIDTGFEAYQKCFEYVCTEENIEYPRMDNFGKDWKKITNEFRSFHARIAALGVGLVVLCHEKLKESMTRTGNKFDMVVPNLSSAADDYYRAVIDNVCWYHYRNRERFLLIKGSDYALAGVAVEVNDRFLTRKETPIHSVPMGKAAKEGYQYLVKAWNNQQEASYESETEKFTEDAIRTSVHENLRKKK